MALETADGRRLADLPLIQAPMAGASTAELAAAVSEAGGLGSVALGALTPERAEAALAAVRARTGRPVACNVFAHRPAVRDAAREVAWLRGLEPSFRALGAEPPPALACPYASFVEHDDLLEVLLAHRAAAVSFHFGVPRADQVDRLKGAGAVLLGCATRPEEALSLEAAGMDLVVLQGVEAGGHRGCFDPADDPRLPLAELLARTRERVRVPLVAAGGLVTGADVARALDAGACAAQLGTAFLGCPEAAIGPRHRAALGSPEVRTAITARISGRPARGIVNGWFDGSLPPEAEAPAYPVAYDAGKALAAAADRGGSGAFDVAWAGTGADRVRGLPAAELVATLAAELAAARSPA
jgi:nitronate monooxygenase